METVRTFLLVAIAFSSISGTTGYWSAQSEFRKCFTILIPGIKSNRMTHFMNKTQLNYACSHLDEYSKCYDRFATNFSDKGFHEIQVLITKTFHYICGDGRDLYSKIGPCLNEEPVRNAIKECSSSTYEHMYAMHRRDDFCDKLKEFFKCVDKPMSRCGELGKKYMHGYIKEIIEDSTNCYGLSSGVIAAILSTVAITTALIAIVIRALVQRKKTVPFQRVQS